MEPHTWKLTRKSAVCIVLSVAAVLCLMVVLSGIRRTAALERVSCQQEAADYLERIGWQVDRGRCNPPFFRIFSTGPWTHTISSNWTKAMIYGNIGVRKSSSTPFPLSTIPTPPTMFWLAC